jgi:hypothetical protein
MQRDRHPPQPAFSREDVVQFYRDLGFFKGESFLECADRLLKRFEHDHGEPLDPQKVWDDVYLLCNDKENVWASDPECDVCAGNEVYREVLPEWSSISKGFFDVEDIEESWHGDEGPITITFQWNGKRCTLHPNYLNDYLDLSILGQINRLIAGSGNQFVCASDVNFAIVFLLDTEGKRRLAEVRRFPFFDLLPP